MVFKILNKKTFLFCSIVSVLIGIAVCLTGYDIISADSLLNSYVYIHDGNIYEFDITIFKNILNVAVLFPFVLQLLTDHKKTNEIYIVSRMANSSKFYYIRFFHIALLCLTESIMYNLGILVTYLSLGKAESNEHLIKILAYTVLINFLVAFLFSSLLQLFSVIVNEKASLALIILLFFICFTAGFFIPDKISNLWVSNFYFVTPVFKQNVLYSTPPYILISETLLITAGISIIGSLIYRKSDRL